MSKHPLEDNIVLKTYNQWNKFGDLLQMHFSVIDKGEIAYYMTITDEHLATPIAAHGGSLAALMDATLGVCALTQVCEEMKVVSTVNMNMNFLLPANLGDHLIGRAKVVKAGKRIVFVEAQIFNQKEQLIATGSATMNAYPVHKLMD
ncbi:MAG: PaaI family thioesterase [Fluviicola sp.]|jgi:uncharacterized protein (TIGR00369 family)